MSAIHETLLMSRKSYLGLIALISVLVPCLVQAQDAESTADVRCVIVGMRLAGAGVNAAQRSSGTVLALYYIGRLDGRHPGFDLEKAMVAELGKMTQADYAADAQRCGRSLQAKGKQITIIGQDLVKRGQEMQQKTTSRTQ